MSAGGFVDLFAKEAVQSVDYKHRLQLHLSVCCVRLEGRWTGEFLLGAGAGKEAERSIC